MCAGRRPLQAASSPVWVGHDAMMVLFDTRPSIEESYFALRASILVVLSSAHARILWESPYRFLGSIPLVKALALKMAYDCRIDEDESFITVDDQNQNDRAVRSPSSTLAYQI